MADSSVSSINVTPALAVKSKDRDIITPEGVRLKVSIADAGTRVAAALVDLTLLYGCILLLALLALYLQIRSDIVWSYVGFFAFLARVLYFAGFELAMNGRTPGKRALRIRVIGRNGAPLEAPSVLARNLGREVEMWLPLSFVFFGGAGEGLMALAGLGWVLCFAVIPLFSAERMRAGDVLAGTWVITDPKPVLDRDLLETAHPAPAVIPSPKTEGPAPAVSEPELFISESEEPIQAEALPQAPTAALFTPTQLDAYGASELNTLAELLYADGPDIEEKFAAVAGAIAAKVDHDRMQGGETMSDKAFLEAYYRAARAKMERDAQWGRLRQDKFDRARPRKLDAAKPDAIIDDQQDEPNDRQN